MKAVNQIFRGAARVALLAVSATVSLEAVGQVSDVNPLGVFSERNHPPAYTPNSGISIELTVGWSQEGIINAIGLRETVPEGWTFAGLRGVTGSPPAVTPAVGDTGTLEFAWIQPPTLPYTFVYDLAIPPASRGDKLIHGALEYRMDAGVLVAPPTLSSITGPADLPPTITLQGPNPATTPQGEPFQEPGYTATDPEDGDITSSVVVSGQVNTGAVGTYNLTYSVTDSAGNAAPAQQRAVTVVATSTSNGGTTSGGGTVGSGGGGGGLVRNGNNNRRYGSNNQNRAANASGGSTNLASQMQNNPRSQAARRDTAAQQGNAPIDVRARLAEARAEAEKSRLVLPKRMAEPGAADANGAPGNGGNEGANGDRAGQRAAGAEEDAPGLLDVWPEEETSGRKQLAMVPDAGTPTPPDAPGVFGAMRQSFSEMGAGGLAMVGLFVLLVLAAGGAAVYVGRLAYRPSPRRKRPEG